MAQINGESERYNVPNLVRGIRIMETLAKNPEGMRMVEIAEALQIPNNSVFRITTTLAQLGYLFRNEETKQFVLTRKLLSLGFGAVHEFNLVEKSIDILRKLRDVTKETVALATLLDHEAEGVVLATVHSAYSFSFRIEEGTRFDLYSSAPGKAMLAFMPPAEVKTIVDGIEFVRFNKNTIVDKNEFLRELATIHEMGYALDRQERIDGCHCVGAPVFNQYNAPIAAIWTTGPSNRLREEDFESVGVHVLEHARQITTRLQHRTSV